MIERFKFKVTVSTEVELDADNFAEAKGMIKGVFSVNMRGFKIERIDPMKLDKPKVIPKGQ